MKKLSFIPLALIATLGAAWAATIIFPNTTEFARVPQGAGTIGGALYGLFNPVDGSARNSEKLAGKYASGYLQDRDCSGEPINRVWAGVDSTGRGICGRITTPLASIGKFTSVAGGVLVKKGGNGPGTPANLTDDLKPGDIIVTGAGGTGTITFTDDLSILRLDTNTTVALSTGENTSGQSVAQAILSDGRLWGRILTSTGVNLGGGGMVAGVRGTSVSIIKDSGMYHIAIPHSISSSAAAHVLCNGNSIDMSPGDIMNNMGCSVVPYGATALYIVSPDWVALNTRKDLAYLDTIMTTSPRIADEITATDPIDITPKRGACGSQLSPDSVWNNGIWDTASDACITGFVDYTNRDTEQYSAFHIGNADIPMTNGSVTVRDDNHFCPQITTQPWAQPFTLSNYTSNSGPYNSGDRTLLVNAFPDIYNLLVGQKELIFNTKDCYDPRSTTSGWNRTIYPSGYYYYDTANQGIYITGSGSIQYATANLPSLIDKTITITVDVLPTVIGKTVADFGITNGRVRTIPGGLYQCAWDPTNTSCATANPANNTITFHTPPSSSAFVVGNNITDITGVGLYNTPLGVTIKKIQISN